MAREEHDDIKTVECLRGRLIAERMVSRTAKDEAEHMAKRLAELEKQLEEEMGYRGIAEKRLKCALKKLESQMALEAMSPMSSSSPNQCFRCDEKIDKWKDLEQCGSFGSMNSLSGSASQLVSQDGSWISVGSASSRNKETFQGDEVSKNNNGFSEFTDVTIRQSSKVKMHVEDNHIESPHESLALVPVSIPEEPVDFNREMKKNVYDVLSSLRLVREQLQNSMIRKVVLYPTYELHGKQRTSTNSMENAATK